MRQRVELLGEEKALNRQHDDLRRAGGRFRGCPSTRSTCSTARTVRRRFRSSSASTASCSPTTSCSDRTGTRAVRAARSSPIASTARASISPIATSRSCASRTRPTRSSRPIASAWDGRRPSSRRFAATSTTTSTCRSPRARPSTEPSTTSTRSEHPYEELPGISAFAKTDDGRVFHTYSSYERGLDPLVSAYQLLDLAPRGRDEDSLEWPMAWLRRHDAYEDGEA